MRTSPIPGISIVVAALFAATACGSSTTRSTPAAVGGSSPTVQPTSAPASQKAQSTVPATTATALPAAEQGSGPQTGSTQSKIDPCPLVTKAEAEAALGEAAGAPEEKDWDIGHAGVLAQCQYPSAAQGFKKYITIQVTTRKPDAPKDWTLAQYAKDVEDSYKQGGAKAEPVQGIGDMAVWLDGVSGVNMSILLFQKKDAVVMIWVPTATPSALDAAKKLATSAGGRF